MIHSPQHHPVAASVAPTSRAPAAQLGFTMIEVLIALVVLAVGLLGLAGLQTFSMKYNHQSYERTQATMLMADIIERMRANQAGAMAGNYNVPVGSVATGFPLSNCSGGANCTAAQIASSDINLWLTSIDAATTARMLAAGTGSIVPVPLIPKAGGAPVAPGSLAVQVTVSWIEDALPMTQTATVRIR